MFEREYIYTVEARQEVLYILVEYFSRVFTLYETYSDFFTSGGSRTRISENGEETIKKTTLEYKKITRRGIPIVEKFSEEEESPILDGNLERIINTRVFKSSKTEIKIEQIFMGGNGPTFGGSTSEGINNLSRYLGINSHRDENRLIGSDEILLSIRIELEFAESQPPKADLDIFLNICRNIEEEIFKEDLIPIIQHMEIWSKIMYRKFSSETLNEAPLQVDINYWAPKIDGIRGRGIISSGEVFILLDDGNLYQGSCSSLAGISIWGIQVEYQNPFFYITDILGIFKIVYNNRTNYSVDLSSPYQVDIFQAIKLIHSKFSDEKNDILKPQVFKRPPLGPLLEGTDGWILVDSVGKIHKRKINKTVEMLAVTPSKLVTSDQKFFRAEKLIPGIIYETIQRGDKIEVIRERRDRFLPN